MKGWWKKWFYLRNETSAPLPVFLDYIPIPCLPVGTGDEEGPSKVVAHKRGPPTIMVGRADRGEPPTNIFLVAGSSRSNCA
jgi:hypothetical protein